MKLRKPMTFRQCKDGSTRCEASDQRPETPISSLTMIHFLSRELQTRMYPVPKPHDGPFGYRYQAYHELLTACGNQFTSGGFARRGWTITTNAEDVDCGRCKITKAWRNEIRALVRQGVVEEMPRYIP